MACLTLTGRGTLLLATFFMVFFAAVLLSQYATPLAHAQSSSCTQAYTPSVATPTGYGASYNLFTVSHEPLVSVSCGGTTPLLTVGSNQSNQYIYNLGYIYQNNAWQVLNLTGTGLVNNAWYPKVATASSRSFFKLDLCRRLRLPVERYCLAVWVS